MKDRIYDDDSTVPELVDGYYYYTKMNASDNFLQYCRKRSLDGTEEVCDRAKLSLKLIFSM